jgi:hypothetical protein
MCERIGSLRRRTAVLGLLAATTVLALGAGDGGCAYIGFDNYKAFFTQIGVNAIGVAAQDAAENADPNAAEVLIDPTAALLQEAWANYVYTWFPNDIIASPEVEQ